MSNPYREIIRKLDGLAKARFIETFGDIRVNSKSFPVISFGEYTNQMNIGPFGSDLKNDCFVPASEGYCMVYEQKHAIDKDFFSEKRYISKEKYDQLRRFDVGPGDILVSCRGTIGKCVLIPDGLEHGVIHPSLMMIKPKSDVNPRFLLLLLEKVLESQIEEGSGVKMAIKASKLSKIQTIYPPKELQDKFVSFITLIDIAKSFALQAAEKYDLLVKSRFIEMFGTRETYSEKWEMKPFTSCCDVLYGFPFNSELFNENSEGMPLIRIRDINTGFSNTYTTEKVDPIYEVHNGDILVGMDGDFCAKQWTSGTALLNQRTCKMKGIEGIVNDQFMLHYLEPELLQIHRNTASTTVKHLSAKEINKMKMPLPPLDLQEEFSAFVEQVDKSKFVDSGGDE